MKIIGNKIFKTLGLFGLLGSVFYFFHIIFGRIFYENYNPMVQAISDLTADNSPSKNIATIIYGYIRNGFFCIFYK